MCADPAALSPAIKPFLDLLAQPPGLKPARQQRFLRLHHKFLRFNQSASITWIYYS